MTPEEIANKVCPPWLSRDSEVWRVVVAGIEQERARCARIVREAQIFLCWGDKDVDGLMVRERVAAAVEAGE